MSRHGRTDDLRDRRIRVGTVAVVWVAGLAAGFFALLSAAAHYGCAASDSGLACRTSGATLGALLVLAVLAVVVVVTVLTYGWAPTRVLITGGIGLVILALCFTASQLLLGTV